MTPWREYPKRKKYQSLNRNISVDTVVIGGGMAGVTNTYLLTQAGQKVALVEKKELGSYATMDTTAFITEVIDTDLQKIVSIYGEKEAKAVWDSGRKAIEEFDRIIEKEKIECEFVRCSNYIYASSKGQQKGLRDEYKMYKKLKVPASFQETGHLGFPNFGFIEVPSQAKFHPTKFLYALAEKASSQGAQIFENTRASKISGEGPFVVNTSGGKVVAKNVVIATYRPLTHEKTHLKKAMYRSYVFELQVPSDTIKEALYEDSSNPYYYFRVDPQKNFDRIIFGGEDHKDIFGKTLVKQSFTGLKKYVDKVFPGISYKIVNRWNGPILEPSDGLALIGEIKPNIYVATGFSGNGMTYSMISALLIRDLIQEKKASWAGIYNPRRSLVHPQRLASKAKDYVEEFFGGVVKNLLS